MALNIDWSHQPAAGCVTRNQLGVLEIHGMPVAVADIPKQELEDAVRAVAGRAQRIRDLLCVGPDAVRRNAAMSVAEARVSQFEHQWWLAAYTAVASYLTHDANPGYHSPLDGECNRDN